LNFPKDDQVMRGGTKGGEVIGRGLSENVRGQERRTQS